MNCYTTVDAVLDAIGYERILFANQELSNVSKYRKHKESLEVKKLVDIVTKYCVHGYNVKNVTNS